MAYYTRRPSIGFGPGGRVPPAIKWLLISNSAIFVVYGLAVQLRITSLVWLFQDVLSLTPDWVVKGAILWQPVTYLFLHDPDGFSHILFNMLGLWMFGSDLERDWGTRRFVNFYLFCGIGAGLCDVAARFLWGHPFELHIPTIGASGAIYGVLLAYGLLYPSRTILLWFFLPIPARVFVLILGGYGLPGQPLGPPAVGSVIWHTWEAWPSGISISAISRTFSTSIGWAAIDGGSGGGRSADSKSTCESEIGPGPGPGPWVN